MLKEVVVEVSRWFLPLILLTLPLYAHLRGVKVFESFTQGTKEALALASSIFPYLLGMLVAIGILRASGFLDWLGLVSAPVLEQLGIPSEVLPMALLRPISGSASLGVMTSLLKEFGPDSLIGRIVSTMQGSTETTFYVLAIYFGSVGITRYRHALWVGLLADVTAFASAVWICRLVFG